MKNIRNQNDGFFIKMNTCNCTQSKQDETKEVSYKYGEYSINRWKSCLEQNCPNVIKVNQNDEHLSRG